MASFTRKPKEKVESTDKLSIYDEPHEENLEWVKQKSLPLEGEISYLHGYIGNYIKLGSTYASEGLNKWIELEKRVDSSVNAYKDPKESIVPRGFIVPAMGYASLGLARARNRPLAKLLYPTVAILATSAYVFPETSKNIGMEIVNSAYPEQVRVKHQAQVREISGNIMSVPKKAVDYTEEFVGSAIQSIKDFAKW